MYTSHSTANDGYHADQAAFVAALEERGLPGKVDVRVGDWGHGALWDRTGYRRAWLKALGLPAARAR